MSCKELSEKKIGHIGFDRESNQIRYALLEGSLFHKTNLNQGWVVFPFSQIV